jgi:hypothetical protein
MSNERMTIGDGEETEEVEVRRPWDARTKMLEEIDARNDEEKASEGMVEIDDEGNAHELEDETEPIASEKEVLDGFQKPEETIQSEPRKLRLKVNGQEREMTQEEVIALAQKVASADEYLRIAKEAATVVRPPAEVQAPSRPDVPIGPSEEDLRLAQTLQVGTTEEAAAVLQSLRQQSLSPDVITAQVRDQLAHESAKDWVQETYQDVFTDPITARLFVAVDSDLLQTGDRRPYRERYKVIAEHIRGWKKSNVPAGTDPKLTDKERRKASVHVIPTAGRNPTVQVDEDDGDENPSAVIAAMAKQRGQIR